MFLNINSTVIHGCCNSSACDSLPSNYSPLANFKIIMDNNVKVIAFWPILYYDSNDFAR